MKVNLVCGIDIEGINEALLTKGVNPQKDRVLEIGAVMWDVEYQQPVKIISELINETDRLPITEEVQDLTGLNDNIINKYGKKDEEIKQFINELKALMEKADFIMAHNGDNYDRPMLGAFFNRFGIALPETPWIDSTRDIEFPNPIIQKSLAMLEYSHGFINPFPHRALTDVLSMLKIASNYEFDRIGQLALSPKVLLVADLKAPNWRNKDEVEEFNSIKNKVSKAKFKWNPDNKTWSKVFPKILLDEGKVRLDFEYSIKPL